MTGQSRRRNSRRINIRGLQTIRFFCVQAPISISLEGGCSVSRLKRDLATDGSYYDQTAQENAGQEMRVLLCSDACVECEVGERDLPDTRFRQVTHEELMAMMLAG
jgi:hypothetical protein